MPIETYIQLGMRPPVQRGPDYVEQVSIGLHTADEDLRGCAHKMVSDLGDNAVGECALQSM